MVLKVFEQLIRPFAADNSKRIGEHCFVFNNAPNPEGACSYYAKGQPNPTKPGDGVVPNPDGSGTGCVLGGRNPVCYMATLDALTAEEKVAMCMDGFKNWIQNGGAQICYAIEHGYCMDLGVPLPSNPIVYGLQPNCNQNDGSKYNICLDLRSDSGAVEDWMSAFGDAQDCWEAIIVDDNGPAISSIVILASYITTAVYLPILITSTLLVSMSTLMGWAVSQVRQGQPMAGWSVTITNRTTTYMHTPVR
jgi:hypothetical protein